MQYKLVVWTYKVLHGDVPDDLGPLARTDNLGKRTPWSACFNHLVVPPLRPLQQSTQRRHFGWLTVYFRQLA